MKVPLEGGAMPIRKFALNLDLPIALDRAAQTSLHQQLCEQLRRVILDGRLSSGTRLPSTRALAQALGVSRQVTVSAYDELFAEGYLEGRRGSGTYVGKDLPPPPRLTRLSPSSPPRWLRKAPPLARDESIPPQAIAFRLGVPSISSLPPRIWREAWKTVTNCLPPNSYGPENGTRRFGQHLLPILDDLAALLVPQRTFSLLQEPRTRFTSSRAQRSLLAIPLGLRSQAILLPDRS